VLQNQMEFHMTLSFSSYDNPIMFQDLCSFAFFLINPLSPASAIIMARILNALKAITRQLL